MYHPKPCNPNDTSSLPPAQHPEFFGPSNPGHSVDGSEPSFWELPPRNVQNERLDPDLITKFAKCWNTKDSYTGDAYDILDDKVRMMLSECFHLQIRSGQLGAIFPRILIGNARLYDTHQMNPMNNFAQSCGQMKNHFDTEVNRSQYLKEGVG
ncbi:hypothetical protein F4804DRAFT_335626 [Jackrogersella minutella]|nr:hypothetical protein F4804DRAFT_335626 [Jackrogersella minutella]